MNNKKQDKDATLWVSIVMAAVLFFPFYGQMFTSCKSEKLVMGRDAQYWYEQYINARHEMFLWENICHQYYEFKDYDFIDDDGNMVGRHNFWDDCISESEAYDMLDSIKEGDWEDFPFDWDNNYSVDF